MTDLEALVANVVEREAAGLDVSDDRTELSATLQRTSKVLRRWITDTQAELETLRSPPEDVSAEEFETTQRAVIVANDWLDRTLDLLLKHTWTMEEFSIDIETEREFLVQHLTDRAELVAGRIMLTQERITEVKRRLKVDPNERRVHHRIRSSHCRSGPVCRPVDHHNSHDGRTRARHRRLSTTALPGHGEDHYGTFQPGGHRWPREGLGPINHGVDHRERAEHVLKVVLFVLILFVFRISRESRARLSARRSTGRTSRCRCFSSGPRCRSPAVS